MVLAATLSMLRYIGGSDDRDFVDRLHSYFTCNILIALSLLVSFKQFGGKPIECLVPDMFSSSWEQYAENYCWAQDTYFVPMEHHVADMEDEEKKQKRISYYQWVPFFLLLEAACFRLPSILWKYASGHSGIKIHEIVKLSSDPNNIKPDIKAANIQALTSHLKGALRFHKRLKKRQIRPHKCLRMFNLPYSASFVTIVYILTKLFYLLNVCLQLLLMNKFLETDHQRWFGLGAVYDLLNGTSWKQSGVFPRVSLCDFDVRVMGNVQEHTIQCVLVINIFNEKIFIFLWFWFMGLMVFTGGSFIYWLGVSIFPTLSRRFIARHLEMSRMSFDPSARHVIVNGSPAQRDTKNEERVARFVSDYLKTDGVFVLRMLTLQTGVIFGTDLTHALWLSYYPEDHEIKRSNSDPALNFPSPPMFPKGDPYDLEKFDVSDDRYAMTLENQKNVLRNRRGPTGIGGIAGGRDSAATRMCPPPAPHPDYARQVAMLRSEGGLNDPNQAFVMKSVVVNEQKQPKKT